MHLSQPPVVLGVGRLTAQKDFETLIRAFAVVQKQHSARLMILGEGEDRGRLERLIGQLELNAFVALPGAVTDRSHMQAASVLVLSSRWEGLGVVLIEAMAVGTPVVATDCPSGPREVLAGGKYGRLVPVGDVEGLAAATLETLHNPPAVAMLKQRANEFSADRAADAYLDLIRPR